MAQTPEVPVLRLGLSQAIGHWAAYRGEHAAMIVGSETLSYAELDRRCEAVRGCLSAALTSQARVGIAVEGKALFVPALVGTIRAGCTAVLCQPGWSGEHLTAVTDDGDIRLFVHDSDSCLPRRGNGDIVPTVRLPQAMTQTGVCASAPHKRLVTSEWAMLFSSGTTGRPKGIVRNDLSILNELVCWCLELSLSRSTHFYVGRPLFYTGGLVLTSATLLVGGTVISPPAHSAEAFVEWCSKSPPSYAFLLPRQVAELVELSRRRAIDPLNTTILTMGEFIDPDLKREVPGRLGCKIIESWGNSEGLGTIATPEDTVVRPESIGRPFLGDSLAITDDQGQPLPYGQQGRLAGSADSCLSYYQNREDLNRCLIKGDTLISEDVGYQDGNGYFFLVGRTTDFVKRDGIPINLREIERHANRISGVRASCAVALPTPEAVSKILVAVEIPAPTAVTGEELIAPLNAALPPSHRVDDVTVVPELDRNAAGKVVVTSVRSMMERKWGSTSTVGPTDPKNC